MEGTGIGFFRGEVSGYWIVRKEGNWDRVLWERSFGLLDRRNERNWDRVLLERSFGLLDRRNERNWDRVFWGEV